MQSLDWDYEDWQSPEEVGIDWLTAHDCIDYLQIQQHEWIEPHGEPCFQEWWVCTWCDETFTEREVDELIAVAELIGGKG